ncbi:MAG: J domain-containing protein [Actinobacteria bacterium]|nr:J domain-containing protein [Actinomycetota bacterium]
MSPVDYYELLGVEREASADEIKSAFRKKARETHPDVNDGHGAEETFKQINEAYEILSDPDKRARYDRFGTADPRAAGGFGADFGGDFFDMNDLFSVFFGGGRGAGGRPSPDGRDMRTQVTVTLEDAATGAPVDVTITHPMNCATCSGSGAAEGGSAQTCPACSGTGQKRTQRRTFLGVMESSAPCDQCGATGVILDKPCLTCDGQGRVNGSETVRVTLPVGIPDGYTLRVPGKGEAGIRNARSGDLLVTVRVKPHEFLHREGNDLHAMAGINIAQAALGGEITVRGLDGDVKVAFGAGVHTGDNVRIRGRGMPRMDGGQGDFIVHLDVLAPKKLSKRQKELLAELGESFGTGRKGDERTPLSKLKDWLGG